jgi:hypothetical protein
MVTIDPVGELVELVTRFTDVALSDPLSALLLAVGGLLTAASVAAFGYLAAGGVLAYLGRFTPAPDGPPAERRQRD